MVQRKQVLGVVIAVALLSSGCGPLVIFGAGAAAGVGGYRYSQGSLTATHEAPFEQTWNAALLAVRALDLEVRDFDHALSSGKISASEADGTPVTLKIQYVSAERTDVCIRVGILGDKKRAVVIQEKIGEVLKDQV